MINIQNIGTLGLLEKRITLCNGMYGFEPGKQNMQSQGEKGNQTLALIIGQNDKFERLYMEKFRGLAVKFGEFVEYRRDRAGRDIGLHFVSNKAKGGEIVDPSLVWFQMKGVQTTSFSEREFNACQNLTVPLKVAHLRFWHIAPEPTYLVLYIEAIDEFFILNIQEYIREKYADEILTIKQETLTVYIKKDSILDAQSFHLIKARCSLSIWRSRIAEGEKWAPVFFRDAEVIRRLSTAKQRNVHMYFVLRKHGAKMRSEAYFIEKPSKERGMPEIVREHWEYMMSDNLSLAFPYIEFDTLDEHEGNDDLFLVDNGDDYAWPPLDLPNGKQVAPQGVFELVEYTMSVTLNDIGKAWAQTLDVMENAGFIELDEFGTSIVSVAPWHERDV